VSGLLNNEDLEAAVFVLFVVSAARVHNSVTPRRLIAVIFQKQDA
jgi:hypothetical protein